MAEDRLFTDLPIWGLVIYTLYKDIRQMITNHIAKKSEVQRKDAESLRYDKIDRTLDSIDRLLLILVDKEKKEITYDQTEIVVRYGFANCKIKIMESITNSLKSPVNKEELKYFILNNLVLNNETVVMHLINDLNKFYYNKLPIGLYVPKTFEDEIESCILTVFGNDITNLQDKKVYHGDLYKALQSFFNNQYSKMIKTISDESKI